MLRKMALLMVLFIGTFSVVSGQTTTKMDARTLLVELGSMLTEIPESTEECQALLKQIKAWQDTNLEMLEVQKTPLRITEPKDGNLVSWRTDVKGTVADPNAEVWVIVHPRELSDRWVQPSVTVDEDGTWEVIAFIGKEGKNVGKEFEIMAVANPKEKLKEADKFTGWPEAQWKSQVIKVIRK